MNVCPTTASAQARELLTGEGGLAITTDDPMLCLFRIPISFISEVIMQCGYRGWIIDATPDFSLGKFFAHARLVRISADDEVDGEMHIERNLSYFDTEEEAIEVAQQWAFAWICERDGADGMQHETPASGAAFRTKFYPDEMPHVPSPR
ncbi:hypothetical protein [Paraburkholderia panacisoli]|uniref:hypothetical protein n=1 Tax=Paraburkholderia panacisoli TaxID=2603818 RepID=UPI00165F06C1|nr:hypothetical protein [Paraburkholderia panacisoli]